MPHGIHSDEETHAFVANVMIAQRETWLAWEDETALGLLVLDGSELDWLFVDPVAQSRGVGSALIEHAKTRSPSGLALWVFESNRRAQAFYERHGFVIVDRTDGAGNEEKAPDIRYAWPGSVSEAPDANGGSEAMLSRLGESTSAGAPPGCAGSGDHEDPLAEHKRVANSLAELPRARFDGVAARSTIRSLREVALKERPARMPREHIAEFASG